MKNIINKPLLTMKGGPVKKNSASNAPYEKTHSLERLFFFTAVVPDGQADAVVKELVNASSSLAFLTHGQGTASRDFYQVFGVGEDQKQIVLSLIKKDTWFKAKAALKKRFAISDYTKGIAFIVSVNALCGISVYKMLTNNRGSDLPQPEKGETKMETEQKISKNYELIVVIVNEGFTDLVMDAAKKAGARGGTILSARGTGNKEIEKFFGVIITPEKQIVLILVPKDIKDTVLNAINKEVSIDTKGQGIAFSMATDDVVGLQGEEEEPVKEEEKQN